MCILHVEFVCKCIYVYFTYILDGAGTSVRLGASAQASAQTHTEWAMTLGLDSPCGDVYSEPVRQTDEQLQGFGVLLFKIDAPVDLLFDARYMVETDLRDELARFRCCDNSARDNSPGSTPDTSQCQTVFAGVYAVGRGPTGTHAALACAPHEIVARSVHDIQKQCAPLIKQFVQQLVERGASAKAGASSMGTKIDGSKFDSTRGRWSKHLGAYYRIPE